MVPDVEIRMVKTVKASKCDFYEIGRQDCTSEQAVEKIGFDMPMKRQTCRRRAAEHGQERAEIEARRDGFAAKHGEVGAKHHQHCHGDDGFRRGKLQELQVVHCAPPLSNRANSGDLKHGSIQFIKKEGQRPTISDAPISITAPNRSATVIGSSG